MVNSLIPMCSATSEINNFQSSIVGSTGYRDHWEAYQQRSFHASGRFWVFYYNGTNGSHDYEVFVSSVDGVTWTEPQTAVNQTIDVSHSFSIWFDGEYVHNFASTGWGKALEYQKGLPNNDGTITWLKNNVIIGVPNDHTIPHRYLFPQGCVDSNGYPWITYELAGYGNTSATFIIKSSTNDGTWVNASGFPKWLSNSTEIINNGPAGIGQGVYPLKNGKILAISVTSGHAYFQAWSGTEWLPKIQINNVGGDQYAYFTWSAVSEGDNVHFVYSTTSVNWGIGYKKYDYITNSLSDEKIVQESPNINWGYTLVPLTLDKKTGCLYIFWTNPNATDGFYNQILYKKYFNNVWDETPTILIYQTENNIPSPITTSAFYYAYDGFLGILFNTGLANTPPFDIHFITLKTDSIHLPQPTIEPAPNNKTFSFWDVFLSPIYIVIIILFSCALIGFIIQHSKLKSNDIPQSK